MSLRDFQDAYSDAMLWANTYGMDDEDGEAVSVDMLLGADTTLLSEEDQLAHLTGEALAEMNSDASAFWDELVEITNPDGDYHEPVWPTGYSDRQAGHDFALTRNGHGAGFWDRRELGDALGERLSDAARAWGEAQLYVSNGEIHHD